MIANKLLQSLTRKGEGTARDPFNPGAADTQIRSCIGRHWRSASNL